MKRFSWTIGLQTAARNQYSIITKWYEHLVCGAHSTRRLHERDEVHGYYVILRNSCVVFDCYTLDHKLSIVGRLVSYMMWQLGT
jgi:hypothetical protein